MLHRGSHCAARVDSHEVNIMKFAVPVDMITQQCRLEKEKQYLVVPPTLSVGADGGMGSP